MSFPASREPSHFKADVSMTEGFRTHIRQSQQLTYVQ